MNVQDIVRAYLESNGYDGLWNEDGECGCKSDDLSPGDCLCDKCRAGYLMACPEDCGEHDYHIAETRAK